MKANNECERCDNGRAAVARVKSEILDMRVCCECVCEAISLMGRSVDSLHVEAGLAWCECGEEIKQDRLNGWYHALRKTPVCETSIAGESLEATW